MLFFRNPTYVSNTCSSLDVPPDNYHQQIDNYATEMLPPNSPPPNLPPKNHYQTPSTQYQAPVQPTQPQLKQNRQYQEQYQEYQGQYYPQYQDYQYQQYQNYPPPQQQQSQQQKIGRIQDYDPISDGPRAPPNTQRASATLIYNSTNDGKRGLFYLLLFWIFDFL
ncbi:hypothetical protein HF086_011743 [Spodoptera exigua]|uniref:Uncharacterized protein n=1 Tax=Spodoptera exigua TaxID=7107 RepID=A0A922MIZ9_SPOEX|nr:hypothetical protein HF086_011743 [Spodoptera exigua]